MTTQRTIWQVGNFRPAHSTENHLRQALEGLGHVVIQLQEDDPATWGRLIHDAPADRPDFVLWTRTWHLPLLPQNDALAALRAAGIPTVAYHLDRWWGLPREHQVLDEPFFRCDVVVTADGGHDDHWAAAGVTHWWAPPGVLGAEASALGAPRREYAADVGFVGSWSSYHPEWPWRRELIQRLRAFYGRRAGIWPRAGSPAIRGPALADLYASVKVVVGDSCLAGGTARYWSDRIPETLGRGGFLIHPHVEGIEDHYVDGKHLVLVEPGSWPAMHDAIERWLADPDGRRQIAAAGREHVLIAHTYERRMADLIDRLERSRVLAPLADRRGPIRVRSGDLTATFDLASGSDGTVIAETWAENVYGLTPDDVAGRFCLDLGANVGAWTVWAAKAGAAAVVAVEPLDANRGRLTANLRLNDVNALVFAVGVAGAAGTVDLGWDPDYPAGATIRSVPRDSTARIMVEPLAHHVALAGGHVDVAKIDVEGAEFEALIQAAADGTLDAVDRIVGEFHPPTSIDQFGSWCMSLLRYGELRIMGDPTVGGQFWWRRYGA